MVAVLYLDPTISTVIDPGGIAVIGPTVAEVLVVLVVNLVGIAVV